MRKITLNLNCITEERLRAYTGRKGELSRIANEAFALWLDVKEGKKVEELMPSKDWKPAKRTPTLEQMGCVETNKGASK